MITEYGRSLYRSNFPIIVSSASVVFHIHSEHSIVTTHVNINIRQRTETWMLLAYHSIKCTYASPYPQWASFTSTSLYHPIWTLPHNWRYTIGCNISIFPYKLLSWTLTILTSLPTIACHQQYHSTSPIQLSASYAIVLFACTSCICKVLLYRISYASTSNNNSCCIVK